MHDPHKEVAYRKGYSDGYLDKEPDPTESHRVLYGEGWHAGQLDYTNGLPWGTSHRYEDTPGAIMAPDGAMVLVVEKVPKTAEFQYRHNGHEFYLRRNGVMIARRLVRFPDIRVNLTRVSGNTYHVIGAVRKAMMCHRPRIDNDTIEQFTSEAKGSDYDNVLQTVHAWVDVYVEAEGERD